MKKYDLTSSKGLQNAMKYIGDNVFTINPALGLAKYVVDKFSDLSKSWESQRDTALELIRKGKEQGVDEMEITMSNKRGFRLNAPVDGVNIDTMIGADEKMHVKVKYK